MSNMLYILVVGKGFGGFCVGWGSWGTGIPPILESGHTNTKSTSYISSFTSSFVVFERFDELRFSAFAYSRSPKVRVLDSLKTTEDYNLPEFGEAYQWITA